MAEDKQKRFYWMRLKEDFFEQHEIRVIEGMENGKEYVLFYLKLMVESIRHEGRLRFKDTIPYNEKMLSSLTGTNIDIVRSAMKVLIELQLCELLDDQTIYLSEVEKLIGSETAEAQKKREQRATLSDFGTMSRQCPDNVPQSIEYRDKSIEYRDNNPPVSKDTVPPKRGNKVGKKFVKPTLEEVAEYCKSRNNNIDPEAFIAHYESNGWKVGKNPMVSWKSAIITWEKNHKGEGKPKKQTFFDELANLKEGEPREWGW